MTPLIMNSHADRQSTSTTTALPDVQARKWRETTHGLVLAGATAKVAADPPCLHGSVSITVTGRALSNDLLLAGADAEMLTSSTGCMTVVPMPLDMLAGPPAIRVLGRGVTEPTRLRLLVELTARNPRTGDIAVLRCEFSSIVLEECAPFAVLDFQLQQDDSPG